MPGSGTGVGPPDEPPPDEVLDDVELLVEELVLDEVELCPPLVDPPLVEDEQFFLQPPQPNQLVELDAMAGAATSAAPASARTKDFLPITAMMSFPLLAHVSKPMPETKQSLCQCPFRAVSLVNAWRGCKMFRRIHGARSFTIAASTGRISGATASLGEVVGKKLTFSLHIR
jgi:hypothetical protein